MRALENIEVVPASVARSATFDDAANELMTHRIPAIAVVDERRRVIGLFTGEELVRGLFPRYLENLRHTAFATDDIGDLLGRAESVRDEPVEKHMRKAVTVDVDASAVHVAERFLHSDLPALPVVSRGEFVGILDRADFCRAMLDEVDPTPTA